MFHLQDKSAQIGVLGEVADVLLHVIGIDLDGLAMTVRCGERNLVEYTLDHGLQSPCANIFHREFTSTATSASASIASSVKMSVTFSVCSSATYCLISELPARSGYGACRHA